MHLKKHNKRRSILIKIIYLETSRYLEMLIKKLTMEILQTIFYPFISN